MSKKKQEKDAFGSRMKSYEGAESERRLMKLLPVVARMDGKCFHSFCRGLKRPYDKRLSDLMVAVMKHMVGETNAVAGYTQSDEITLAWFYEDFDQQMFFDGRIQKINSWLAALTSVVFNRLMPKFDFPEDKVKQMPTFDSRVWNVPNLTEAANCFLWREMDATKNSVSMAAQAYFSHKQLQGKSQSDMHEMLWAEKGINWSNYPDFFKRGTYAARRKVCRPYTTEELEVLPAKHAARTNPGLLVERMEVVPLEMPPFVRVQNREEVLFQAKDFVLAS